MSRVNRHRYRAIPGIHPWKHVEFAPTPESMARASGSRRSKKTARRRTTLQLRYGGKGRVIRARRAEDDGPRWYGQPPQSFSPYNENEYDE